MNLCSLLVWLLPSAMRSRMARPMVDAYRDGLRARKHSSLARLRFRARTAIDLIFVAVRARRSKPHLGPEHPLPGSQKMENLLQDLRHATRSMTRAPLPTIVSVVTLALGIGVTAAVFGLVDTVLLAPLPFPDADRLAIVWERNDTRGWSRFAVSPPNYLDWKEQNRSFAGMTAYYGSSFTLTGGDSPPERADGRRVDHDYFRVLGIAPALGRGFAPDEATRGSNRVVVLGAGLWNRRYGGDPRIVGESILVDGEPHRVAGVLDPTQSAGLDAEIFKPLAMDEHAEASRGAHYFRVIARLQGEVSLRAASEEMISIADRLPLAERGWSATVDSLYESTVGAAATSLRLLAGIGALVLLIACGNVANLLLAKFGDRGQELSMRAALGAGRARLARLVIAEALLTTGAGALLGFGLAGAVLGLLRRAVPEALPRLENASVDWRLLLFSSLLALVTGLVVASVPAWRAGRVRINGQFASGGTGATGRRRLATAVVVGQIALATAATVGAGLLVRSLLELQAVDPGFQTENRLTFRIGLPDGAYPERAEQGRFWTTLLEEIDSAPGVLGAGATSGLPLRSDFSIGFSIVGRPTDDGDNHSSEMRVVTEGYFGSMGIPLLAGRGFQSTDRPEAPPVVVVNRAFADRYFPGESPIGHRLEVGYRTGDGDPPREIVGVVGNVRVYGLGDADRPLYYLSARQFPLSSMAVVVRADSQPDSLLPLVRERLASIDDQLPIYSVTTVREVVRSGAAGPRFRAALVTSFGLLALLLASVGIYGNLAYVVLRRTPEIGLRLAVGADRTDVRRWVVATGLKAAALGLPLGMAVAVVGAGQLSDLLYGVDPRDPVTYLGVAVVLLGVVLTACLVPAARATRVDPVVALRNDT